jgi:hypothetical protein
MTIFAGLVGGWLTRMFDERAGQQAGEAIILAAVVAGYAAALLMLRRIIDPGPLARGEARWRYRSRALRERIARARTWFVLLDRKPGWWTTRLEFAVGIAALVATSIFALAVALREPSFGAGPERYLPWTLVPLVGVGGSAVGLAWMIRIYRAPLRLDSSAYWRYRDGS